MNSINIHQPGSINEELSFPSDWNELTADELLCYSRNLLSGEAKNTPALRAVIFAEMIKTRVLSLRKKLPHDWQNRVEMEDLVAVAEQALSFLFEDNTLTEQLFPYIRLKNWFRQKMYGPAAGWETLTCGELEQTEVLYGRFMAEPDNVHLAGMAAILWRPRWHRKFIRYSFWKKEYTTYGWEKRVKDFAKLPPELLYSVFVWYVGCRQLLPRLFPLVYEGGKSADTGDADLMAFTKCIHSGAGPKNGSRVNIRLSMVMEFFFEMQMEAQKAKDLEREINRRK